MFNKEVTVLIPVYNGEKYIGDCLESLLNQTYQNYKILVVNDGSSDNTLEVLKKYPVEVISYEQNKGISYALNLGIQHINSDYIIRMDSDDLAHYDRIRMQVAFMEKNPHIFMSCCVSILEPPVDNKWKVHFFNEKHITTVNELRMFYLFHPYLLHPGVIFRTQEWKAKKYSYNSQFDGVEDFELHRRIIMEEEVYLLHLPLIYVRKREGSASSVSAETTLHRLFLANKNFYEKLNIKSEVIRLMGKGLFPKTYHTTLEELREIKRFTYSLLEIDYFKTRIKKEMLVNLFDYLDKEIKDEEKH